MTERTLRHYYPRSAARRLVNGLKLSFHTLVLAVYPVLFLVEHNPLQARPTDVVLTLLLFAGGGIFLLLTAHAVLGTIERAAQASSLLILFILGYGPFVAWLQREPGAPGLSLQSFAFSTFEFKALCGVIALFAVALFGLSRLRRRGRRSVTVYCNLFAGILLSFPLAGLGFRTLRHALVPPPRQPPLAVDAALLPVERPNIYHIVLDAYGREDVLRDLFEHSNAPFLEYLRGKGFQVAGRARANYPVTILSLSSVLNADYLQAFVSPWDPRSTDDGPIIRALKESAVVAMLRSLGYRIITHSSGYYPTEISGPDVRIDGRRMNGFLAQALGYVQLPLLRSLISERLHLSYRQMLLSALASLPDSAELPGPNFVFAHIVAPHPPFVFSASGEPVVPDKLFSQGDGDHYGDRSDYRMRYIDQLVFVSRKIQEAIAQILESDPNAVILLQGDHGPGSETEFRRREQTNYRERFGILLATRLPPGAPPLPEETTPINAMRMVLNSALRQELPLLPERSWYSGLARSFDLRDVTAEAAAR